MKPIKETLKIISIPVLGASLCCLSPLLLFVFGLGSLSFAASLADIFYGEWKWAFRTFGLFLLAIFLFLHFRKEGICTFDAAKRHRNKILNTILVSVIAAVLGYWFFLYVVVHYWGVFLQLWE